MSIKEVLVWNVWPISLKRYELIQVDLSSVGNIVLREVRILTSKNLQKKELKLAHGGHRGIVRIKQC